MNTKQVGSVRRAISRARGAGSRVRYSKFVKDTVTSWLRDGESPSEVSMMIGIGQETLIAWSKDGENTFRKVQVSLDPPILNARASARLTNGVRVIAPSIQILIETLEFFK